MDSNPWTSAVYNLHLEVFRDRIKICWSTILFVSCDGILCFWNCLLAVEAKVCFLVLAQLISRFLPFLYPNQSYIYNIYFNILCFVFKKSTTVLSLLYFSAPYTSTNNTTLMRWNFFPIVFKCFLYSRFPR